jgi:hypothetical protein
MMQYFRYLMILILSILSVAWAAPVGDLYKLSIPVVDQSSENRDAAVAQGLAIILIKVSGNSHVAENTKIKKDLTNAADLVQQYSYEPNTDTASSSQFPYLLDINFQATAVNNLLVKAKLFIWGDDRPLTIFWIADSSNGAVKLLSATDNNPLLNLIEQNAQRRAIPVIFPVLDLTDLNQVSVNDVVAPSVNTLNQASTRYGSNAVAIVRVSQEGATWKSLWTLALGNSVLNWSFTANNLDSVVQQGVDNIANALANQFASSGANHHQALQLRITNINSLQDYAQAYRYLEQLALVDDVLLLHIDGTQVTFSLTITGTVAALQNAINLDNTLTAITGATVVTDTELVYQWTP